MAIAKMQKVTLISFRDKTEQLLESIQSLQSFEVIDMPTHYEQNRGTSRREQEYLEQQLKETDARYTALQDAIAFLEGYLPKKNFKEKYRTKRKSMSLKELTAESHPDTVNEILTEVEKKRTRLKQIREERDVLYAHESFLLKWKNLSFHPGEAAGHRYVGVLAGTVPQTAAHEFVLPIKQSSLLAAEEVFQSRDEYGLVVYFDKLAEAEVRSFLEGQHFQPIQYEFAEKPAVQVKAVQREIELSRKAEADLKAELAAMQNEDWQLKLAAEYAYARLQRLKSRRLIMDEKHLFVLEGWLETDKVAVLKEQLAVSLNPADYALLAGDVNEEDYEEVPIVLKNNALVAPFETVTTMYSLPKYNEIDPTPFLTPFYLLFFGMMLADLGYGILLWLGTFLALRFLELSRGMKKNLTFFHYLSYPTMLWGLVYGSFFGLELPFVLLSTSEDVNTILVISVIFGVVQILFGLGIKTYLSLRDKNSTGAVADGIGWIGIFIGIILLLLGNMVLPSEALSTAGAAVAITSAVAIIIASAMGSQNKALGAGLGLYNLYGITGYVGDIVSYTRLMALGVSGGSIGLAFNMIIGFLPFGARISIGVLLFVLLHSVNFGLSMLSAYVHGARLIFVEFFGKFYEGGGRALEPLKGLEDYIYLKKNKE